MSGNQNLQHLLANMKPKLREGDYVFCTVSEALSIHLQQAVLVFKEEEGVTLILQQQAADALQLPYQYIAAWISLTVHSSLEAVGLTAAVATALAGRGISCNVVAAYYHDHLFVKKEDALQALSVLETLSNCRQP